MSDLIRREDAIDVINIRRKTANIDSRIVLDEVEDRIRELPSERAKGGDAEIPSLEQYPYMKQSPNSGADLISRVDVLALAEKGYIISNSNYKKVCELINELPSADTQTSVDLISRADAVRVVEQIFPFSAEMANAKHSCITQLNLLPSADRPSGEWIMQNEELKISDYRCSECGHYQDDKTDFCPNCGAKMGDD